jgi:hypothetical protein
MNSDQIIVTTPVFIKNTSSTLQAVWAWNKNVVAYMRVLQILEKPRRLHSRYPVHGQIFEQGTLQMLRRHANQSV